MKKKSQQQDAANLIGQRLKYEIKSRGISSVDLAKRADVKTSFIYDVISGKSANPSTVKLARVADALGITLATLVDSLSSFAPTAPSPVTGDDYIVVPYLSVHQAHNKLKVLENNPGHQPFCFLQSWITRYLGIALADLRLFAVSGDGMEPTLYHNDIVLVDIARKDPTQPGIFVLADGYGMIVKRVERISNSPVSRLRIISDNPQYSIYENYLADTGIIGRVVWFSRGI